MPPTTEKQRKAMGAAAGGNSTLGIPKHVGREFMKADSGRKLPEAAKFVVRKRVKRKHRRTP